MTDKGPGKKWEGPPTCRGQGSRKDLAETGCVQGLWIEKDPGERKGLRETQATRYGEGPHVEEGSPLV